MRVPAVFSRPVAIASIPPDGAVMDVSADEAERAALAAANDLLAVNALTARIELAGDGKGGVTVVGRVHADVVQTCVVSLAPVEQHVDEQFQARFVAPGSPEAPRKPRPGAEVMIRADEPEPAEVIVGADVDIGALVEEYFVLSIDPYPRAPGAVPPADLAEPRDTDRDSPFAALAGLTGKPPEG